MIDLITVRSMRASGAVIRDRDYSSEKSFEFKHLLALYVKENWWRPSTLFRLRGRPATLCTKRGLLDPRTEIEWFFMNGAPRHAELCGRRLEGLFVDRTGRFITNREVSMLFWQHWEQDGCNHKIIEERRTTMLNETVWFYTPLRHGQERKRNVGRGSTVHDREHSSAPNVGGSPIVASRVSGGACCT